MRLGRVVLDASVALRLVATGREAEVLRAVAAVAVMTPRVKEQVSYLLGPPDADGAPTRLLADLRPLERAGLLEIVSLDDSHADAFVECAAVIDDCDAESIALAGVAELPLASDDRKQRRIFAERNPGLLLISTLEILHAAEFGLAMDEHGMSALLASMRTRTSFAPSRSLPLCDWYLAHLAARGLR